MPQHECFLVCFQICYVLTCFLWNSSFTLWACSPPPPLPGEVQHSNPSLPSQSSNGDGICKGNSYSLRAAKGKENVYCVHVTICSVLTFITNDLIFMNVLLPTASPPKTSSRTGSIDHRSQMSTHTWTLFQHKNGLYAVNPCTEQSPLKDG